MGSSYSKLSFVRRIYPIACFRFRCSPCPAASARVKREAVSPVAVGQPSKDAGSEEADKPPATTDGAGKGVAPVPVTGLPLKYEQVNGFNPLANAVQAVVLEHPLALLQAQGARVLFPLLYLISGKSSNAIENSLSFGPQKESRS